MAKCKPLTGSVVKGLTGLDLREMSASDFHETL